MDALNEQELLILDYVNLISSGRNLPTADSGYNAGETVDIPQVDTTNQAISTGYVMPDEFVILWLKFDTVSIGFANDNTMNRLDSKRMTVQEWDDLDEVAVGDMPDEDNRYAIDASPVFSPNILVCKLPNNTLGYIQNSNFILVTELTVDYIGEAGADALADANDIRSTSQLFMFVVRDVMDRIRIYLNRDDIPTNLNRIVARVVASVYTATEQNRVSDNLSREIHRVSDNGQSITYMSSAKNYLHSTRDNDLFMGFEKLLAPHRLALTNVVTE